MNAYIAAFKNYAVFKGRSTRRDFWMFVAINLAISMVLSGVVYIYYPALLIKTIYDLVASVPFCSITVRRLHDVNRSGWWMFVFVPFAILAGGGGWLELPAVGILGLVGIIGAAIYLLILYCQKGDEAENRFGPPPVPV